MNLAEAFKDVAWLLPSEHAGIPVSGIKMDSRQVQPGDLFLCMPSSRTDAHQFLMDVQVAGASAAVGYKPTPNAPLPYVQVPETSIADLAWRLARSITRNPLQDVRTVGVTGTNGKTTTAWLVRQFFESAGVPAAYLGTLGIKSDGLNIELPNTTPFAVHLYNYLAQIRDSGSKALALEISSHALSQHRADGIGLDVGVFTNLTQDHLDFHGSMDAYAAAKFRLFSDLPLQSDKHFNAVLNVGDPIGKSFADQLREAITFQVLDSDGGNSTAHWVGYPMETKLNGNRIRISYLGNDLGSFDTPLAGGFNHENVLAALVASVSAGVPLESALRALGQLRPVPGRFEMVTVPADVHVIVDYAHTPDALIKLLSTVRRMTDKRILTVFGCGGDRDRTKRPLMAAAVSSESNLSVVTSDNPRTENAEQIIADVMKGVQSGADAIAITDRKEAIRYALSNARSGDVVIIAGKGHETYQIIGSQKIPFDDRTVVKEHFCS